MQTGAGSTACTTMTAPEALARQQIDRQLAACGWAVQDYRRIDPAAGGGNLFWRRRS